MYVIYFQLEGLTCYFKHEYLSVLPLGKTPPPLPSASFVACFKHRNNVDINIAAASERINFISLREISLKANPSCSKYSRTSRGGGGGVK